MFKRYFYAEEYPRTAGSRSTIKKTAQTTVVSYMYNYNMVYEKCIYSPFTCPYACMCSTCTCPAELCVCGVCTIIVKRKYNNMYVKGSEWLVVVVCGVWRPKCMGQA